MGPYFVTLFRFERSPSEVGLNFIALPSWGAFLPRDVAPSGVPASECSTVDTEQRGDLQVQRPAGDEGGEIVQEMARL